MFFPFLPLASDSLHRFPSFKVPRITELIPFNQIQVVLYYCSWSGNAIMKTMHFHLPIDCACFILPHDLHSRTSHRLEVKFSVYRDMPVIRIICFLEDGITHSYILCRRPFSIFFSKNHISSTTPVNFQSRILAAFDLASAGFFTPPRLVTNSDTPRLKCCGSK